VVFVFAMRPYNGPHSRRQGKRGGWLALRITLIMAPVQISLTEPAFPYMGIFNSPAHFKTQDQHEMRG